MDTGVYGVYIFKGYEKNNVIFEDFKHWKFANLEVQKCQIIESVNTWIL